MKALLYLFLLPILQLLAINRNTGLQRLTDDEIEMFDFGAYDKMLM